MIYTAGGTHLAVARAVRTAGDQVVTNTAGVWTAVDTATDLVLTAAVGDVIEIGINRLTTATANLLLDIATVVGGNLTHYVSSNGGTSPAAAGLAGEYFDVTYRKSTPESYVVQAGDLVAGQITLRLVYQCGASSGTLYGSTNFPLMWQAVNFGH